MSDVIAEGRAKLAEAGRAEREEGIVQGSKWRDAAVFAVNHLEALLDIAEAAEACARFESGGGRARILALREALARLGQDTNG